MQTSSITICLQVFIPDDLGCATAGLALAEMSEAQLTAYRRARRSAFRRFAEWLQGGAEGAMDGKDQGELQPGNGKP